jgi:hypothetical protein
MDNPIKTVSHVPLFDKNNTIMSYSFFVVFYCEAEENNISKHVSISNIQLYIQVDRLFKRLLDFQKHRKHLIKTGK